MKRYFKQLDQNNIPIDVYHLVLNEIEPPLLSSVMSSQIIINLKPQEFLELIEQH